MGEWLATPGGIELLHALAVLLAAIGALVAEKARRLAKSNRDRIDALHEKVELLR